MAARQAKSDFAAKQRQLNEELKSGDYRRIYLLCGEQAYLRLQNKDKLVKALLGDGDEMNLSRYSGSDVTSRELIEMAQTLPFFADRRVIVLENTGLLNPKAAAKSVTGSKSSSSIAEEADRIADYIAQIPDTTAIVLVEENVDKRGRLYKAIAKSQKEKTGEILECTTPDEGDLRAWAAGL
ncbi:MAG: DNA polymerase III subunit delta, partial [Lachnospiraceae bacterium]